MANMKKKSTVKAHAGQAKALKKVTGMSKGGSTVTKQVTIPSLGCARVYSTQSKLEVKAVAQVNGQPEKLRCWLNSTKQKAEATSSEGSPKVPKKLDKTKVAYQEWQA